MIYRLSFFFGLPLSDCGTGPRSTSPRNLRSLRFFSIPVIVVSNSARMWYLWLAQSLLRGCTHPPFTHALLLFSGDVALHAVKGIRSPCTICPFAIFLPLMLRNIRQSMPRLTKSVPTFGSARLPELTAFIRVYEPVQW